MIFPKYSHGCCFNQMRPTSQKLIECFSKLRWVLFGFLLLWVAFAFCLCHWLLFISQLLFVLLCKPWFFISFCFCDWLLVFACDNCKAQLLFWLWCFRWRFHWSTRFASVRRTAKYCLALLLLFWHNFACFTACSAFGLCCWLIAYSTLFCFLLIMLSPWFLLLFTLLFSFLIHAIHLLMIAFDLAYYCNSVCFCLLFALLVNVYCFAYCCFFAFIVFCCCLLLLLTLLTIAFHFAFWCAY